MKNCVVYIDHDNIKFSKYDKIICELFKSYNTTIKIFINENELKYIDNINKLKYNLFLCNSPAKTKNSADISLTIECMKDICSNLYDTFIIISNDTDFIPLCKEIKSKNKDCYLCYDGNFNSYLNEIYDKTYNLSYLLKLENDKKQKELDTQKQKELDTQKQKELNKKEKKLKIKLEKDNLEKNKIIQNNKLIQKLKNKLDTILNTEFNNDIDLVTFDHIQDIFKNNNIDFRKDIDKNKIKLKKFLEIYISNKYMIKKNKIYINK